MTITATRLRGTALRRALSGAGGAGGAAAAAAAETNGAPQPGIQPSVMVSTFVENMKNGGNSGSQDRKRPLKPHLFDLLNKLTNYGVGRQLARKHWVRNGYEQSFWTISRVENVQRYGDTPGRPKAYGTLTWKGVEESTEKRIKCSFKRQWRVAPEDSGQ